MLNSLRSFAGSPLGIVVFAALIFGLLFFGLRGFGGSSMVAHVGSQSITQQEFNTAYQRQLQTLGVFLTPTRAFELQVPQSVLNELIQRALLREEASALGLGLSDETVATAVAADPAFQQDGQFELSLLENYLTRTGQTRSQLLDLYRDNMLNSQIFAAIRGVDATMPVVYRRILAEFYGEERILDYTVLTPDMLEPGPDPTDEEVQAYYDDNADKWHVGETRQVVLLELSPSVLADPSAVTDEDVAAAYEQQRLQAEKRDVWQQVFTTQDEADAVQAQLDAGQTFDDLVAAGTITPVDLGMVGAGDLFDPAVADAAFAMDAGATQIVAGRSGATLVHVASVSEGDLPTLDEMADQLRQQIAQDRTLDRLPELTTQIDEARDSGQSLQEVGATLNIPTQTVTFDADGNDQFGDPITDLPGGNALVTSAFEADIGTSPSPVPLSTPGSAVWYQVLDIIPEHQLALEDIRDRVVAAWRADQDQARLQELGQSVAGLLSSNTPTTDIETQLGVTFAQSAPLTRTSSPEAPLTAASLQAAFGGQLGDVTTAANAAGDGLIVQRVAQIITPDFDPAAPDPDQTATATSDIADETALAYIFDLQGRIPVTYNMDLLRQLVGAQ